MKKASKKFIRIAVLVMAIGFVFMFTGCGTPPPEPSVKRAEFNFTLVYEENGEEKTIEDVMVCEFVGSYWGFDRGKWREWSQSFVKCGERITLWSGENVRSVQKDEDEKASYLDVYFNPGTADYYMSDDLRQGIAGSNQFLQYYEQRASLRQPQVFRADGVDDYIDDPYERFGIKVISWECDPPIANTFE